MATTGIKTLLYLNEHNESQRFAGGASGYLLVGTGTDTLPEWKTLADAGIATVEHNHALADCTGTLAVGKGGTGATSLTGVLLGDGTNEVTGLTSTTTGHVLQKTSSGYGFAALPSHASTATTYGVASTSNYGHAMATGTTPKAPASTAALGSETAKFARGDHVHPLQTSVPGNAGTATKLANSRNFSITGGAIANPVSFDGSGDVELTVTSLDASKLNVAYLPLAGGLMNGPISSRIIESYGRYYGCYQYQWNTSVTTIAITTPFPSSNTNGGTVPASDDGEQFFQLHITGIDNASNGKTLDVKVGIAVAVGGAINSSHSGWSSIGTITPSSVKHGTINNQHAVVITLPAVTNGNHMRINVDACFDYWAKRDNNWVNNISLYTGSAWSVATSTTGITLDSGDGLTYYAASGNHEHLYAGSTEPGGAPKSASVTSGEYYVLGVASANTALKFTSTANKLVKFNGATGVLTAPTFVGALTGNVTGNCTGFSGSCTGNAETATSATNATNASKLNVSASTSKLYLVGTTSTSNGNVTIARDASVYMTGDTITATTFSGTATKANEWSTGRTITLTGGVTGTSAAWTGSGNLSIATTLSSHNHAAGDINSGVFGVGRGGTGLSTYAKGDILYCSEDTGTDPVLSKLSIGSANQMLTVDPTNGIPAWDTVPIYFAVCDTAAATTAKVASSIGTRKLTSETLTAGTICFVRFTVTNSGAVASLTLNIDGTGAKPIKQQLNTSATSDLSNKAQLIAGNTYMFQYNGTNWVSTFNYNNTYSEITDANLQSSTSSTAGLITGRRFAAALNALIADTLRLQITDSGSTAVDGTPVLAITGSEVHWAALNVRERRYLKLNDSSSGITTSGAGYTISQTANSDLTVHLTIGNGATSNYSSILLYRHHHH